MSLISLTTSIQQPDHNHFKRRFIHSQWRSQSQSKPSLIKDVFVFNALHIFLVSSLSIWVPIHKYHYYYTPVLSSYLFLTINNQFRQRRIGFQYFTHHISTWSNYVICLNEMPLTRFKSCQEKKKTYWQRKRNDVNVVFVFNASIIILEPVSLMLLSDYSHCFVLFLRELSWHTLPKFTFQMQICQSSVCFQHFTQNSCSFVSNSIVLTTVRISAYFQFAQRFVRFQCFHQLLSSNSSKIIIWQCSSMTH